MLTATRHLAFCALLALPAQAPAAPPPPLSPAALEDRIHAAWTAQILATLMGFQFEHKPAAVAWVDKLPKPYTAAPVDDDYYYELVALRAFEGRGIHLNIDQLGRQWIANNAGSWGSSEQTRLLLARGIPAAQTGHPRYNKLWFTIGPQFSADIYGLLAPAMPNRAARLARDLARINGHAEAVDGAVFVAGMVSLAFRESDPRRIVKQAANLIHPGSPYRQCLDLVIRLSEQGLAPAAIASAVEDRFHIEYPATNNAVANGGLVAIAVWHGGGDFLKTVNLAFQAADFTDADCNAANAAAVVGAMKGMQALPPDLVASLNDRIAGDSMGGVPITPPVDERISDIARRTAALAARFIAEFQHTEPPTTQTQPLEQFRLSDLTRYWNPDWTLERAGFGGAGGGLRGLRGNTYLDGDVLHTYPRDEVRGLVLRRRARLTANPRLALEVSAPPNHAWQLSVYLDNERVLDRLIEGAAASQFQSIEIDLARWANRTVEIRLLQTVLVPDKLPGNAMWKSIVLSGAEPQ